MAVAVRFRNEADRQPYKASCTAFLPLDREMQKQKPINIRDSKGYIAAGLEASETHPGVYRAV